jgi:hypothetical protein
MHRCYRLLTSFDDVVEELGGVRAVGELTNQNSAAVCNWKRRRSRFPTKYFFVMQRELEARGAEAPRDLWGFVESKR